ncbi:MAG TPA: L-seryl-tRNA(Sec) selenium transferase [Phycisphaerae bacterium]
MNSPETQSDLRDRLRALPAVNELLNNDEVRSWISAASRTLVVSSIQDAIQRTRRQILAGNCVSTDPADILLLAEEILASGTTPALRRVINATGIVLHTGLGRAPLADAVVEAIVEVAAGYSNLELNLETGERGRRTDHVRGLLCRLLGCESATVVNNNAAATYLILRTLAEGREVVVSRGELVEIGGSFRLPDIMSASGAILREVGTTNRTRIGDYASAINERTAILLHVHASNYRIVGFTEAPALAELAELAHRKNLICVHDLGSGALFDFAAAGLPPEPDARRSLQIGADLVCFSGDKLLGGPQAGIIAGRHELIERIERSPLMRTYRVDKLTFAALDATLRLYLDTEDAIRQVPALAMLSSDTDELAARAHQLREQLTRAAPGENFIVCSDVSYAGGGALPAQELPTVIVQWRPAAGSAEAVAAALRRAETPVIARIRDESLCFDLRTVKPDDFEDLVAAVVDVAGDETE